MVNLGLKKDVIILASELLGYNLTAESIRNFLFESDSH